jgi:hypothetical protein
LKSRIVILSAAEGAAVSILTQELQRRAKWLGRESEADQGAGLEIAGKAGPASAIPNERYRLLAATVMVNGRCSCRPKGMLVDPELKGIVYSCSFLVLFGFRADCAQMFHLGCP